MNQDNKFIRSLIQSSLQGNNSALEQLFNMNLGKVYTLALRLTANFDSADKLTEMVFVETWKQLGFLRDDATFSSWITGITVYQCLRYLRDNDNPQHLEAVALPSKDTLEKVILSLPKNERVAIVLHYLEKYTLEEVADLLAVTKTEISNYIEEGEKKIINRSPDITSSQSVVKSINKIKVDINPNKDLINQAFVSIYRTKSEEEVKEKFLNEKQASAELKTEEGGKEKGGIGGLFKKILPKSKK